MRKLSIVETLGLDEPHVRLEQARLAILGDPYTPRSKWGLSSLKIYRPVLSVRTWAGHKPANRKVPITNFFNRTQTPISQGWSVRKTQVCDFRGKTATYDSHNGTDFTIPPGIKVCAPAAGVVRRVSSEFHRGGLKILIDHGQGLITTSGHLGRSLVKEGDEVELGQVIALSGYSGIDALVAFPWSPPHVHFNVWLNGVPVDPFAKPEEESVWVHRNDPKPAQSNDHDSYIADAWNEEALDEIIQSCVDPVLRHELTDIAALEERACHTIFKRNYFPTRFESSRSPYLDEYQRKPRLYLPFHRDEYDGVSLLD